MRINYSSLFLVLLFITTINLSCKKDPVTPIVVPPVADSGKVVAFTDSNMEVVEALSTTSVTFQKNDATDSIKVGDFIVSCPLPNAPFGFLRKVKERKEGANSLTFETENALLSDVFEKIQLDTVIDYTEGGRNSRNGFTSSLNAIIYDEDRDFDTTHDQIKSGGTLTVSPSFTLKMDLDWRRASIDYFKMGLKTDIDLVMSLIAGIDLQGLNEKKELVTYPLPPFTIVVGGIPIVFTNYLIVSFTTKGELYIQYNTTIRDVATIDMYVEAIDNKFNDVFQERHNTTGDLFDLATGIDVELGTPIFLETQLYDFADLRSQIGVKPYAQLKAEYEVTENAFDWVLQAGVQGFVDVEAKPFNFSGLTYQAEFLDRKWGVLSGSNKVETTFVDERDNMEYQFITINGLKWMNENLNYSLEGSLCKSSCSIYGRYYNGIQVANTCPANWRLPTIDELGDLTEYKDNNPDKINIQLGGNAGVAFDEIKFYNEGEKHYLWSSSNDAEGNRIVKDINLGFSFGVKAPNLNYYNCRCVQD